MLAKSRPKRRFMESVLGGWAVRARSHSSQRWRCPRFEQLEDRTLLSADVVPQLDFDAGLLEPMTGPSGALVGLENYSSSQATASTDAVALDQANVMAVARSINAFARDLYAKLQYEEGNLFFSPLSISTALAMIYAGAGGKTASQMADVLHFTLDHDTLHPLFGSLVDSLNAAGKAGNFKLSVANALWAQEDFPLREQFVNLIQSCYGDNLKEVDFISNAEAARQTINQWVEGQTHEKIKGLIPPDVLNQFTRLILTNAIYFKGQWASKFDLAATRPAPFTLASGEQIDVPMMHNRDDYGYMRRDGFQVLEMPYVGNRLSMIVLLPTDAAGESALDASLLPANLNEWLANLHRREVIVSFPKFEMRTEFYLKEMLERMGMADAFSDSADFSGVYDVSRLGTRELGIKIDDVIHKTFVEVNEEGTEAAAASAVHMTSILAAHPPPPVYFTADHPFLFLIRDNQSGSILYMGRVMNPVGEAEPPPASANSTHEDEIQYSGRDDLDGDETGELDEDHSVTVDTGGIVEDTNFGNQEALLDVGRLYAHDEWNRGSDNDQVYGSAGDNSLLDNAKLDLFYGQSGNVVLIGSGSNDPIDVTRGRDLFIGGTTSPDANAEALTAVVDEWTAGGSIHRRIGNLGGPNGLFVRAKDETIFDDGQQDTFRGELGQDWFLFFDTDYLPK